MSVRATPSEKDAGRHADRKLRLDGLVAKPVRVQACTKAGPLSSGSLQPSNPGVSEGASLSSDPRPRWLGGRPPRLACGVVSLPSIAKANGLKPANLAAAMVQHGATWSQRLPNRPSCSSGVFEAVDANAVRWMAAWLKWGETHEGRSAVAVVAPSAMVRAVHRNRPAMIDLLMAAGVGARSSQSIAVVCLTHSPSRAAELIASLFSISAEKPFHKPVPDSPNPLDLPVFHAAIVAGHVPAVRAVLAHPSASQLWNEFNGKTPLERAILRGEAEWVLMLLEACPSQPRIVPPSLRDTSAWRHAWQALIPSGVAALLVCLKVVPSETPVPSVLPDRMLRILAGWPDRTVESTRATVAHDSLENSLKKAVSRSRSFRRL